MILPRLAEKLSRKEPAFGTSLRFNDPGIIEMIGEGWDFVWIDMQHGYILPQDLAHLVRACELTGCSAIVRLAGTTQAHMLPYILDLDVAGLLIAQVESVQQAQAMVHAAKFPPLGDRSWGGRRIIDRNDRSYHEIANQKQLLLLQIENREVFGRCEAIAAVPGVDGLMIGPDDVALRLGVLGKQSPFEGELWQAAKELAAAAHNRGKLAMNIGAKDPATIELSLSEGFDLISMGADASFIAAGSRQLLNAIRQVRQE